MAYHTTPRSALACHAAERKPRLWKHDIARMTQAEADRARWCQACPSREVMLGLQGDACAGCAKLPENLRGEK